MKTCLGCKHAEWKRTAAGRLHPSGDGHCDYPYSIPPPPNGWYWLGDPKPLGGFISRSREYENHCPYYNGE